MSDTQGIDAPNCAHKLLKKQMVGEQFWYICECGQKGLVGLWDGKVSVLAPPDPRKDLVALEELVEECGLSLASGEIRCNFKHVETFDRLNKLRERLAEMRGAKRETSANMEADEKWHFKRTCGYCGCVWSGLHCPHDGYQNPCPDCGVRPAPIATKEYCACEFDD